MSYRQIEQMGHCCEGPTSGRPSDNLIWPSSMKGKLEVKVESKNSRMGVFDQRITFSGLFSIICGH